MEQEQSKVDPREVAKYILEYQKQMDNMIKYQLDSSEELDQLRRDLLGVVIDENGMEIELDGIKPKISKEGARSLLSFLRLRLTKVISLSNLDEEQINKRCRFFIDGLTYFIMRHIDDFQIPDLQTVDNIIDLFDDVFFTTMMKAYDAGERDTLRKQFTHVESSEKITQQKPEGQSLFRNPFSGGTQ